MKKTLGIEPVTTGFVIRVHGDDISGWLSGVHLRSNEEPSFWLVNLRSGALVFADTETALGAIATMRASKSWADAEVGGAKHDSPSDGWLADLVGPPGLRWDLDRGEILDLAHEVISLRGELAKTKREFDASRHASANNQADWNRLLNEAQAELDLLKTARPRSEWHEDVGEVLWWRFPIEEAPFLGTPHMMEDVDVDGYPLPPYTHWTPIPVPGQEN